MSLVNREEINTYLETIFRDAPEDGTLVVNARTIGEKGTPQEGKRQNFFAEYRGVTAAVEWLYEIALKAEAAHQGVFVVPGLLSHGAIEERKATENHINGFSTLVIDIDDGDVQYKIMALHAELGEPELVVASGGKTAEGQEKAHVYWPIEQGYVQDPSEIARVREVLANRCGGDPSFKRMTQIIRVPGTAHLKHGEENQCYIKTINDGHPVRLTKFPKLPSSTQDLLIDASSGAGSDANVTDKLTSDVHEGGTGEENRWSTFSSIAGHYVYQARIGNITVAKAREFAHGWMVAHMVPAWPDERFDNEFAGVLRADIKNNGAMPARLAESGDAVHRLPLTEEEVARWRIGQYTQENPKPRRWLVKNLVLAQKKQMLVAAGGAGKSYAVLDLGLRIAAAKNVEGSALEWMGHEIDRSEAGVVVILSCEDDKEEVNRRLHELDPAGELREAAADSLIVIPADDIGGSFPFVSYDNKGLPVYSEPWQVFLDTLSRISKQGTKISLVVIDTLNATLHGDENSAQIASEYISAVSPITGKIGAGLIVTHHVRKGAKGEAMTDELVRGSNALINGMRNVLGMYQSPDWEEIMPMLGLPPVENELFEFGVIKGNISELSREREYLLRGDAGYLIHMTGEVNRVLEENAARDKDIEKEREAWVLFVIDWAARQGKPFKLSGEHGVGARAGSFPQIVTGELNSPTALTKYVRDMKSEGKLVSHDMIELKSGNRFAAALDVPGGVIDSKERIEADTSGIYVPPEWGKVAYDPDKKKIVNSGHGHRARINVKPKGN